MELDKSQIDDAVLALLYLNKLKSGFAWKQFDWDSTDRLFDGDFITDPKSKAKSVVLTEKGEMRAKVQLARLFGKA